MASPDRHFAAGALFTETAAPGTPNANDVWLYPKSDKKFHFKDDTGAEFSVGTIAGTSGTVANAIIRADSTGGATVQSSDINVDDATTSTANNVAITNQHAGQTNSALVLTPKGTGAFILGPKPDGTATGGNARGSKAICLVGDRSTAAQVASGNNSVAIGYRAIASGATSVSIGDACTASGVSSFAGGSINLSSSVYSSALGRANVASGSSAFCAGANNTASGGFSGIPIGYQGLANRYGMQAHAAGQFAAQGDAQRARFVLRNATTNDTPTALFLDGSTTRLTIPVNKAMGFTIQVVGSYQGMSENAYFVRKGLIVNDNLTTTIVGSVETLGTDQKSAGATGTDVTVTADDTNEALIITVTGIAAQNWRWVASVDAVEVLYA
jgi:hypothetical protein